MSGPEHKELKPFSGRFASSKMETAYQAFVFKRNLTSNVWGSLFGLFLFIIYVFSDYIDAVNPTEVVAIRVAIFCVSLALLSLLLNKSLRRIHDIITTAVIVLMGVGINLILWMQPTLENTYYIALIQGYILFSLLLRLSYPSMVSVFLCTQIGFMVAAFTKEDTSAAVLQSSNVGMVGLIAVAGVYLLQRYQRVDFLKSETISEQNAQLNVLLEDARRDNKRKVAALNMLVHVVKTPLHQISGFSDIVMQSLKADNDQNMTEAGVDGARYIKDATANLARSINNLLVYHRLDEVESRQDEQVSIKHAIDDFQDLIHGDINVSVSGSISKLKTHESAIRTTIQCLADFYNASSAEIEELVLELEQIDDVAKISFSDNGPQMSSEQFVEETKPLTKFEKYLTGEGTDMPMKLRTVARAAEVCGGAFEWEESAEGNKFALRLKGVA